MFNYSENARLYFLPKDVFPLLFRLILAVFKSTFLNYYFLLEPSPLFLLALIFLPNLPFPKFSFNSYKLAVYCHLHCRRQFPTGFIYDKL